MGKDILESGKREVSLMEIVIHFLVALGKWGLLILAGFILLLAALILAGEVVIR